MLERFSDQARQAVELARVEARRLGHGHVGTEHLLLGILAEGGTQAARALTASGASLAGCRELAAEAVGEQGRLAADAEPRLTPRANRALERAARLALRRRDEHVETSHVLLSVLDVEGRAGQVLRGLAVDLPGLRAAVDSGSEPGEPEPSSSVAAADVVTPRCARCDARLDETLTSRVVTAQSQPWTVAYCGNCGAAIGATPG